MKTFDHDDAGYLAWISTHSDGFVLNVRRQPDPDYVVLHRATCGSIRSYKRRPGAFTERSYRKAVAQTVEELRAAAESEGRKDGSFSKRCGRCRP